MDSIDNLILHLPHETKHLFKKLCISRDYRYDLEDIEEFLGQQLLLNPYPALQIVKYHSTLKQGVLADIVYKAFIKLVKDERVELSEEYFDKFLNFTANFRVEDSRISDVCEALKQRMSSLPSEKRYKIYLSFVARSTRKLFHAYNTVASKESPLTSKAAILPQTLHKKEHFIANLINEAKTSPALLDNACAQLIAVIKTVRQLSTPNQSCKQNHLISGTTLEKMHPPNDPSLLLHVLYYDFHRMENILDMLRKYVRYELPLNAVSSTQSFLELMLKHTKFASMNFESARDYVEKNQTCYNKMLNVNSPNAELHVLVAYHALSIICDIYFKTKKDLIYSKTIDERLSSFAKTIRSIENCNMLSKLLQNVFLLLFLRWESVSELRGSEEPIEDPAFDASRDSTRIGFVCNKHMLEKILNIIRSVINERLSNPAMDEPSSQSLLTLRQAIDDALWRMDFLQKNKSGLTAEISTRIAPHIVPSLFVFHEELLEQRTSDDEPNDELNAANTLPRKKPKLRRRRNSMPPKAASEGYGLTASGSKDSGSGRIPDDRGVIARMLASPADLAKAALGREDIELAKTIIEKFNLKDASLERDISFLQNMCYIKSQLQKAIARYEEQETFLKSKSTIEHIKKVAAIGFETSRITNIIEEFSHANHIVPAPESSAIIEKYSSAFPFLRQYQDDKLQICIILDLILQLNMNHELSSNLWNMSNRLYASEDLFDEFCSQQEVYRGVGALHFFNNIVQCQHLFKSVCKENLGVKQMLRETFFTLRSNCLKSELEKENVFKNLFKKSVADVNSFASLKAVSKNFEEIKAKTNYFTRFSRYIANSTKLLEIVNTEYSQGTISQILSTNMRRIIGEILFEQHVAPADIEALVFAVNLNLIHTIALNVCPVVDHNIRNASGTPKMYEYKEDPICAYVSKYNILLSYILQQISGNNNANPLIESTYFERAMTLPEIRAFANIYNNNLATAALLFDHLDAEQLGRPDCRNEIIPIFKVAQDKFHKCTALTSLKDEAIKLQVQNDINEIKLTENISDLNVRIDIILKNIVKIQDSDLAVSLIKNILLDDCINDVDPDKRNLLERYLKDIHIFSEVAEDFLFRTWSGAYMFGEGSPQLIMKKLIELKKYELCCEWWELHNNTKSLLLKSFYDVFFQSLKLTQQQLNPHLVKIIESFPAEDVVTFFEMYIEKFKNLSVLQYAVDFLVEHGTTDGNNEDDGTKQIDSRILKYQNYRVSVGIFNYMTPDECEQNWNLLSRPLLMIEQLVMNSRFEILSKILTSVRPLLEELTSCKYCSNHSDMIYEIPMNSSITLGNPKNSAFILLNFNLYQSDHAITASCIDTLLQIYATKALDYRINETPSSNDPASLSTEMASLDSLCGAFVMPKEAPTKDNWIKDEDSMQCMCCKRAIFTMLTRRHHCRRCGRVVCHSCSTNRLKIQNLYEDIPVRVCTDCFKQTQAMEAKSTERATTSNTNTEVEKKKKSKENDWQLSGNLTHDKLLREEFSYEYAPSTHLCLSILSFHSNNAEYVNLLLHHCRKFEKLLRPLRLGYPNPEIDYALVAKMLNSLALAAKVRGGPPECDTIRVHSEIIISVVQNGCEALLPVEPLSQLSLRKLGDSMVLAEKWHLALDIYLKCGHSTAGVMAAYGLACLRAGRYETAREQLFHCMTRHCKPRDISDILKFITTEHELDLHSEIDIPTIKRPNRSPPLLDEIIKVIESTSKQAHVPETLARADSIRNSNTSLASTKSRPKDKIPILEPAMNIINTISNLKQISQGNYCDKSSRKLDNQASVLRRTQVFEECLFYLLSYGAHVDIVNFLIRHDQTMCALRYFILQNLENEIFIKSIYVRHLKRGRVDNLIRQMIAIDPQLSIWKDAIIQTCRYLETKNLLNSLYHLQILLNDPIRASMTCVKFYSMNCTNFRELQNNSFHLINAQKHLQSELEMCQWENINLSKRRPIKEPSFLMQMDAKTLNCHINTILRQMEVTKFLAKAEQDEKSRRSTRQILRQIGVETTTVPTLFDSLQERIQICILVLLCGNNIEEGFGLAYRIIQDYNLPSAKIYATSAKYLASNNRLNDVKSLISCIKSNNGTDQTEYDKIISLCIHAANNTHLPEVRSVLDDLIKMISDVSTKISCHIYVGQLKSAYLLAVQHDRLNDIMKILSQAEATNQIHIVRLCEKKLNINQR